MERKHITPKAYENQELVSLIGLLSQKLMKNNLFFATAESCTGGLLAAYCTELPGSSTWFTGSVVSYANTVKQSVLAVQKEDLQKYGAVSQVVVEQMAKGASHLLDAQVSVAISGIAGPDGGTTEKPVGTVWLAAFYCHKEETICNSSLWHFSGNRKIIRKQALIQAIKLALRTLPTTLL